MIGPSGVFPRVTPDVLASWDTTGQGISLLFFSDSLAMRVGPGMILAVDSFGTDLAGLAPTDPISSASLELLYKADGSYTGTAPINWALQGGTNNSWFVPGSTGNLYTNVSVDLFALGVTNVASLRDMNVSFVNNGVGTLYIDRIGLNVTKGIADKLDKLDVIVYNGSNPTNLGDTLVNFTAADKLVFVDVNMTGRYYEGDPLILTSSIVGAGGVLSSADEVLTRADGPQWRTLFNPFPVNDDPGGKSHYMPRIVLNPFGYITAIWQDWRGSAGPDIYAATAKTDAAYGPNMAFYLETDENRAGPGGNVSCSIWVRNIGQVAAKAVNVSNVFPTGLEFISSDPAPDITVGEQRWWNIDFMSSLGYEKIVIQGRVNSTLPFNTVLRTEGVLNFTDLLGGARPEMFAWLDFIASDLIPPVITHTPPGDMKISETVVISGEVTDDSEVDVVKLYIKPIGATYFNPPIEATPTPDGYFLFEYNVGQTPGTVEYYLEAVDIYGNAAKSPVDAPTEVYRINVTGGGGTDYGLIAIALGIVLLVGAILAAIYFMVLKKRKQEPPMDEQREAEPPPSA